MKKITGIIIWLLVGMLCTSAFAGTVSGKNSKKGVPVSSILLNKTQANLFITTDGKPKVQLDATVYPYNAEKRSVSWKSSNIKVATVSKNGLVTGKGYGTCVITATAKDGSRVKASCVVKVEYSEISAGGLKFKLNNRDNTAAVIGAASLSAEEITIPETVKANKRRYNVTSIASCAFQNMKKLSHVTLGKKIAVIGESAFESCTALRSMLQNSNITKIDDWAFADCKKLGVIYIPKTCAFISDCAFAGDSHLTIIGKENTYPAKYAHRNDIPFATLNTLWRTVVQYINGSDSLAVMTESLDTNGDGIISVIDYKYAQRLEESLK